MTVWPLVGFNISTENCLRIDFATSASGRLQPLVLLRFERVERPLLMKADIRAYELKDKSREPNVELLKGRFAPDSSR